MLYTNLTKKAMNIAYEAHKDQFDRGGVPYVFHPYQVAQKMDSEEEICVALLHDVVEDTEMTLEELLERGFPERVIAAVDVLTRRSGMNYMDYIRRVKTNPLAVKVKIADIEHNSDESRAGDSDEDILRRRKKYQDAKEILLGT